MSNQVGDNFKLLWPSKKSWTLSFQVSIFVSKLMMIHIEVQYFQRVSYIVNKPMHFKVHKFWEDHKILRNLHRRFDHYYLRRTNLIWRFFKILWPSQNIWTLPWLDLETTLNCLVTLACSDESYVNLSD